MCARGVVPEPQASAAMLLPFACSPPPPTPPPSSPPPASITSVSVSLSSKFCRRLRARIDRTMLWMCGGGHEPQRKAVFFLVLRFCACHQTPRSVCCTTSLPSDSPCTRPPAFPCPIVTPPALHFLPPTRHTQSGHPALGLVTALRRFRRSSANTAHTALCAVL